MIELENVTVSEWMSTKIISVGYEDRFIKIEEMFESHPVHHLIVMEKGELAGIISTHDMMKAYGMPPDKREKITAKELMTAHPLTIDMADNIGLAADIILANKFHALPVVDGNELVGIITSHDLIKFSFNL